MYLVQFLFSFLERIAFFNCARHSVSGQTMQFIPLCRVPPFGSIAWGFDKLTHHGNPLARALPIGARIIGQTLFQIHS